LFSENPNIARFIMGTLEELTLPIYYVVNRNLPQDQAISVLNALSITPICCVITGNAQDVGLALSFASEITLLQRSSMDSAVQTAKQIGSTSPRPPLVVGEADILDAVFSDGHKEQVACSC
jgi:hypothetical protein